MNIRKKDSRASRFEERPLKLEVLLVYEDGATARRGKRAVERVLSQEEVMADGQFHVWRQEMLGDPACQAEACRDALDADIIVVSAHGHNRLASEAEASLKQWVGIKRRRPCALVISLDGDPETPGHSHPALLELRSEAARNGLTVLLQFGEAPPAEMNAVVADIRRRAKPVSPVLEEILHRPRSFRRWGINE